MRTKDMTAPKYTQICMSEEYKHIFRGRKLIQMRSAFSHPTIDTMKRKTSIIVREDTVSNMVITILNAPEKHITAK